MVGGPTVIEACDEQPAAFVPVTVQVVNAEAVEFTTAPVVLLNVDDSFHTQVEAPEAVNVPLPQKTPLLEGVMVTVGFVLTVAVNEDEVTESPETEHVIMHLYN